jgi:hypothetical protein
MYKTLWLGLLFLFAGTLSAQPDVVVCPACKGEKTCAASNCDAGKVACPGKCLKASSKGWKKKKVDGHRDDELWMEYTWRSEQGTHTRAWSQGHIGEVIEILPSGEAINRGRCEPCGGSSFVACKPCSGTDKCTLCAGVGELIRGEQFWTLSDRQGRQLEGVIKSRTGNSLLFIRAVDLRELTVALDLLDETSRREVEKRFPE